MNPLDRDVVIAALEANLATLERLVAELPPEGEVPRADGRWSACQVLEHLVLTEGGVHRLLRTALEAPPSPRRTREKDALVAGLATLPQRVTAPAAVAPAARFAATSDALAALRTVRAQSIELARTLPAPWDAQHVAHPFFGALDIGQWLLMLATHGDRHAAQIAGG